MAAHVRVSIVSLWCHTLGSHNPQACVDSVSALQSSRLSGPPQLLEFHQRITPVILNTPPWAQYFTPFLVPNFQVGASEGGHPPALSRGPQLPHSRSKLVLCRRLLTRSTLRTPSSTLPPSPTHSTLLFSPVLCQHTAHLVLWALHAGGGPPCQI